MESVNLPWWKEQAIYQIYPMSYCDSNGDGIGDINGIISKLDYIKSLGVGAVWLSPVYPSPNRDNGYDISNYCDIHKNYGTLEDMDRLISEAKKRGLRIIMDLVINHTSDQHEWFLKSRQRIDPYTDYYIWHPGKKNKKPSNWGSFFGEDCWKYDELRKEYYLHLFAKEQPDLNYRNSLVIESIKQVMSFWLDRGVSGFRCDVINILYKESLDDGKRRVALTGFEHYHSRQGTHDILNHFNREIFSKYDCYTVGETVFISPKMADDLTNPSRGELNSVFSFEHMETDCYKNIKWFIRRFSPSRFLSTLMHWQKSLDWNTLYFENHDQPRSVSRFGSDGGYHNVSAKAIAVLLLSLKGTPFIFEGQEIGMTNFDFADITELKDVESHNIWKLTKRLHFPKSLRWRMIKTKSRDNARTPMQWNMQKNAGFTTGTPWLGVNKNYKSINVESQQDDKKSILSFYKRLIKYRNSCDTLKTGDFCELYNVSGVCIFDRKLKNKQLRTIVNLTAQQKNIPKEYLSDEVIFSGYEDKSITSTLRPYEAVILNIRSKKC